MKALGMPLSVCGFTEWSWQEWKGKEYQLLLSPETWCQPSAKGQLCSRLKNDCVEHLLVCLWRAYNGDAPFIQIAFVGQTS